jgi:hypothetical protein
MTRSSDARAFDAACKGWGDIEKKKSTDIKQLRLHGLILGDRTGGGIFRSEPVRIKGSSHVLSKSWKEVMQQMEDWERSRQANPYPHNSCDRATCMVCIFIPLWTEWRTARAITNLN